MAAKKEKAWRTFQEEMKRKRTQKAGSTDPTRAKKSELIVQRLSAEVSGKSQKLSRVGPREFVQYNQ